MSDQTIDIHNPAFGRAANDAPRARVPFPPVADGDRLRVVFIDNEKPNTTRLLELVAQGLTRRYEVEVRRLLKGGAAHPAPEHIISDAAQSADLAVLATAD